MKDLVRVFDDRIRQVSREVIEHYLADGILDRNSTDTEAHAQQQVLQRILCKEFISAKEPAVLLNCSERHIHNLVDRARRGISDNPIPYRKVGDTTTLAEPSC